MSTTSVGFGEVAGKSRVLFTEDDIDVGQKPTNYYVRTKLEAEKRVVAARSEGVRSSIYRVGNITFDSRSGRFQENIDENGFYRQVKAFVNLGAVSETADEVDFSFVDQVSRSILALMRHDALLGETWHIQSPHVLKLSRVLTDASLGLDLRVLSFGDFIDYLASHRELPELRACVQDIMLHRGWLSDDRATSFEMLQTRTDAVLDAIGFHWSVLEVEQMQATIVESLRERLSFLAQVPLFAGLPRPQLERLAAGARLQAVAEEADLLWEGHPNEHLHVVLRGALETSRHSLSGWLGLISVVGAGDFVGEGDLFGSAGSAITAQPVLDEAVVLSIRRETLQAMVAANPEFGWSFLQQMNTRVRRLERLLVETA